MERGEKIGNSDRRSTVLTLERSRNFEQDYDFGSKGVCHIYTIKI
jgi:hypothetical protein